MIYRVAQEALTNVLRHSRCTEVAVSLAAEGANVVLAVSDNGHGLPEARTGSGLGACASARC